MYYIYGVSVPSLLIESTDSMIMILLIDTIVMQFLQGYATDHVTLLWYP